MSSKPTVSAIIIFLDAERFIEEAIESVFAQTYRDWELLLVDDGSTDGGTRIAQEYARRKPGRVRYLQHPGHQNRGMSASRNLGIASARGEYTAFLDADDVWLPHKLEQQVAILDSHPESSMVAGTTQYWYSWTGKPEDARRDFRDSVEEHGFESEALLEPATWLTVFLRAGGAAAPCICSTLIRRKVAMDVGGSEEKFRGQYEDQVLFIKVGLQAPVFVASECWSRYRQHPDSSWVVTQKADQQHSARLFFLDWLAKYLSQKGVETIEVWELLREQQLTAKVRTYLRKREWRQAMWGVLVLVRCYPQASFVRAWQGLGLSSHLRHWLRTLLRR